ncbi:hypothetical protein HPB51_013023 [Rhipicephalus microplus]|uniref:Cadherin domain-containing protein n=1 Tax=Rhipicephalus microplus TaxID=6941 RepID=A0A9J6F3S8_RHIMP|nr:hypothetical protein HPB51_013023 [Rhipicephalus microplus]
MKAWLVLQVSATDRDTGNNARLSFRLTASGEFGIFPNSGLLYIREPLDREACDLHWLSVVVVDNGSPAMSATASVEVHVLDANDNAPEFSATSLELAVPENLPAGHLVGQLQARDQDAGSNAVLRYSLLHSNGSSFKVDPVTGDVHSLATLDREVQASYELLVRVQDQGTPTLSSTARLRISVVDENDNAPVFVEPLDRLLNVREHQPVGSELVQVRAVDADEGPNGQVIYEIVPGGDRGRATCLSSSVCCTGLKVGGMALVLVAEVSRGGTAVMQHLDLGVVRERFDALQQRSGQQRDGRMAFSVDAHTGRLITRLVLDRESQEEFSLVVVARDRGHPPREARLALLVRVLGLHHLPGSATPGGSMRRLRVREGAAAGTVLGSLAPHPAGATFCLLGEPLVFDVALTSLTPGMKLEQSKSGASPLPQLGRQLTNFPSPELTACVWGTFSCAGAL